MITIETLRAKIETLRSQLTQHQANANATQGAIQVCEMLIAEEEQKTEAPKPPEE